jgi:TetR/AcrR family transcriptional repressor of mexJK operon
MRQARRVKPYGDPEKRAAILRAARAVFLRQGYDRTVLKDVADAAGVSRQTIYNHWSDKAALFLDVIAGVQADAAGRTGEGAVEGSDVEAALCVVVGRFVDVAADHDLAAVRDLVTAELKHHPQLRRAWLEGAPSRAFAVIVDVIARFEQSGELVDLPSLPRAANQLVSLASGEVRSLMALGTRKLSGADKADIVVACVAMFLRAYRRR